MSRVLVIVVTYNGTPWLERCLSSVCSDLYVWDNDSTDGSADLVASRFPQAHLVRSAENVGFAKANNMGFQYALDHGYDYVYLLNQDAWLEEGALDILLAAASAHPEFAVLSPLQMTDGYQALDYQFSRICGFGGRHALRNRPGTGGGTCPGIPNPQVDQVQSEVAPVNLVQGDDVPVDQVQGKNGRGSISGAGPGPAGVDSTGLGGTVAGPGPGDIIEPSPKSGWTRSKAEREPISVKRVMAAHWLVPVKAIREIGLFNEELFPLYGQDDDWCNRARYKGWKIGGVKEARAVHDRANRPESKERLIERNYRSASLVRLADPNRPRWASFLYVCLYTLVKAIKYRSLNVFRAFRQICSQLSAVRAARR